MNYHLVHAHDFRIHVSEAARFELGGAAALESIPVQDQLAAMAARVESRDYGADCPAGERAENAASVAADYGHATGFYRCAATPQVMILSRQLPSPDHILVSAAEYAELKARNG